MLATVALVSRQHRHRVLPVCIIAFNNAKWSEVWANLFELNPPIKAEGVRQQSAPHFNMASCTFSLLLATVAIYSAAGAPNQLAHVSRQNEGALGDMPKKIYSMYIMGMLKFTTLLF